MTTREEMTRRFPMLLESPTVYSEDGEKLGKIKQLEEDHFVVEKGWFFPKEFSFRYSDIEDVTNDEVKILRGGPEMQPWRDESYPGWSRIEQLNRGEAQASEEDLRVPFAEAESSAEELRVPIAEEKLEVHKEPHVKEEVVLRKIVHSDLKTITVPLTTEEVRVERRPVEPGREVTEGEARFTEEEISVPVMEEEAVVTKRPVVKEEISVKKGVHVREEEVEETTREEDVEVERRGRYGDESRPGEPR